MAATWTKAGMVRRAFKGGRPLQKDRHLTAEKAVLEACMLREDLRLAMLAAGLSPEDVSVELVMLTDENPANDNRAHIFEVPGPGELGKILEKLAKIPALPQVRPVGMIVAQIDQEAERHKGAVRWVQPFLTGPRAANALLAARDNPFIAVIHFED